MFQLLKIFWLLWQDKKHGRISKIILVLLLLYVISPIDFVPDFALIVGWLDDLLALPILLTLAYRFIPKDVLDSYWNVIRQSAKIKKVR